MLQGVTKGDKKLQGVKGGYKGLHRVTRVKRVDRGLQGVTRGYEGLQGVTSG